MLVIEVLLNPTHTRTMKSVHAVLIALLLVFGCISCSSTSPEQLAQAQARLDAADRQAEAAEKAAKGAKRLEAEKAAKLKAFKAARVHANRKVTQEPITVSTSDVCEVVSDIDEACLLPELPAKAGEGSLPHPDLAILPLMPADTPAETRSASVETGGKPVESATVNSIAIAAETTTGTDSMSPDSAESKAGAVTEVAKTSTEAPQRTLDSSASPDVYEGARGAIVGDDNLPFAGVMDSHYSGDSASVEQTVSTSPQGDGQPKLETSISENPVRTVKAEEKVLPGTGSSIGNTGVVGHLQTMLDEMERDRAARELAEERSKQPEILVPVGTQNQSAVVPIRVSAVASGVIRPKSQVLSQGWLWVLPAAFVLAILVAWRRHSKHVCVPPDSNGKVVTKDGEIVPNGSVPARKVRQPSVAITPERAAAELDARRQSGGASSALPGPKTDSDPSPTG